MKNISSFVLMYIAFFIYSLSGLFSKIAASYSMLSWQYIVCFSLMLLILAIYSILWQQVLKKIQLSVAMANKPITIILIMIFGWLFFDEFVSFPFFIGMGLILIGLVVIGMQND